MTTNRKSLNFESMAATNIAPHSQIPLRGGAEHSGDIYYWTTDRSGFPYVEKVPVSKAERLQNSRPELNFYNPACAPPAHLSP